VWSGVVGGADQSVRGLINGIETNVLVCVPARTRENQRPCGLEALYYLTRVREATEIACNYVVKSSYEEAKARLHND
jgi:hypothetical protein